MVPGAGHFYKGTPESVALGVGILGSWLTLAYLGFSESSPGLTQPQWGGLAFAVDPDRRGVGLFPGGSGLTPGGTAMRIRLLLLLLVSGLLGCSPLVGIYLIQSAERVETENGESLIPAEEEAEPRPSPSSEKAL